MAKKVPRVKSLGCDHKLTVWLETHFGQKRRITIPNWALICIKTIFKPIKTNKTSKKNPKKQKIIVLFLIFGEKTCSLVFWEKTGVFPNTAIKSSCFDHSIPMLLIWTVDRSHDAHFYAVNRMLKLQIFKILWLFEKCCFGV